MTRHRPKPQTVENTPYYASQELYQTLFEQAAEGIFIADAQGRIVEVNRCGCVMLGYTREEMLNLPLANLISAEELAHDSLRLEEVRADKNVLKERRLRTKDGRLLPVEINARRLPDGNLLGMVRDISARKRLEAQSLEGQERFRLLSESSLTGVYLIQEGRFRYVNPAMARMFGYTVEELVDRRGPLDLVHPDDHPLVAENIRRRLEAEVKEIHYEFRGLRKDGLVVHIEVHGRRIEHDGRVGVIGTLIDITDRKRAQEERLAHLRFFENMNRVNQAIQGTNDLEQMMSDVLDALLEIFGCDRAWLVYPCDPAAATWQTPMERTRPEYPGVLPVGVELPLEPAGAAVFQMLLDTPGPVTFGPESPYPVPEVLTQVFKVQSFIVMAFYPKIGKPWSFGLHQCSYPRVWSSEDQRLFQEIAHRLADALSSLLAYRDLQESERRYREIFENSSDAITIAEVTQDGRFKLLDFNPAWEKMAGLKASHLTGVFLEDLITTETTQEIVENYRRCLENETPIDQERELVTPAGHWHIHTTLVLCQC